MPNLKLLLLATCASALEYKPVYNYANRLGKLLQEPAWEAFKPLTSVPSLTAPRNSLHAHQRSNKAYCMPGQSCWPSAVVWAAFNTSVDGTLLAVQPAMAVCGAAPNSPACSTAVANYTNPYWRADQPGAMQDPYWEADSATGAACQSFSAPCVQGAVPTVAVAATAAAHVSAALSFAAHHNIRVSVKSSGHEYQGRSTGEGTLSIWLHNLRGITINTSFTACDGDAPQPAITVHPGDSYGDVYAAAAARGYEVVGGSARTVSAAGGHFSGGGHSFMSTVYGLTADNVLAVTVVLANGTLVTASACEHPDLFWALRGGGGGTFGVLISVTHKLHSPPATGVTGYTLQVYLTDSTNSVGAFLYGFLELTPGLLNSSLSAAAPGGDAGVWSGYWSVQPATATIYVFSAAFACNCTPAAAAAALAPFLAFASSRGDFVLAAANATAYPSYIAWHDAFDPAATADRTGTSLTIGSRFVPLTACMDDGARLNATTALTAVASYVPVLGHLVVGGAVAEADPDGSRTSVGPAFRAAGQHICLALTWPLGNNTPSDVQPLFEGVSNLTALLRYYIPDSGAYWSESDYLEPDWQLAFWGQQNYARLQSIKASVDPTGVFECWHCVELPAGGAYAAPGDGGAAADGAGPAVDAAV